MTTKEEAGTAGEEITKENVQEGEGAGNQEGQEGQEGGEGADAGEGKDLKAPGVDAFNENQGKDGEGEGDDKNDDDKNKDPAIAAEEGEGKDADPDKTSTDIVFPEGTLLSEEQQSEFAQVLGTQENLDKMMGILQNISSDQAAQAKADAEAKANANVESLKKDSEFGKDYEANMKSVNDLATQLGEDFTKAVDTTNPAVAKALLVLAKERADADIHVNNKVKTETATKTDAAGNKQLAFGKTLDDLKERM